MKDIQQEAPAVDERAEVLPGLVRNPDAVRAVREQQTIGLPSRLTVEEVREEARPASREAHPTAGPFNLGDRVYGLITAGFAGLILAILLVMIGILLIQAWPSITRFGFSFLTGGTWDPIRNIYGAGPAILGTIYSSLFALLLAAPVGVLVAVFLVEMAPLRVRFSLGFLVELLAAVPSIVYGLWALYVVVPLVRQYVEPPLINSLGNTPLFSGYPLGLGMFSAGLVLAIMVLPTIAAISRDVITAVPNSQREAMLALGATRWEMVWRVVVPYARSGIIGAVILALGRALGETMAVQMVIGNTFTTSWSLFQPATTLTATMVNQFADATGALYRSALIEMALILMLVTILLNAVARLLVWSVTRGRAV